MNCYDNRINSKTITRINKYTSYNKYLRKKEMRVTGMIRGRYLDATCQEISKKRWWLI
jgi:hypothetical protein